MKKIVSLIILGLALIGIISLSGCKKKAPAPAAAKVNLNYYKLFDDSKSIQPIIKAFQNQYPHITINYKKFADPVEYEDLIVNEIAEGSGPDIFSLPNTWIKSNYKKITPAPADIIPTDAFAETFVDIAWEDLVYGTGEKGAAQVYALPLSIDTLAVYYNKDLLEKQIPERGRPGTTWSEFEQDVIKLRRVSNNNVLRAGAAIGRADNIARSIDLLYALMLQYNTDFYGKTGKAATFATQQSTKDVLTFLTSFANPGYKAYTWSKDSIATNEDELENFVTGKTAMMFGYSHLYQDIINRIKIKERNNQNSIEATNIRISTLPQINTDASDQVAYAHYFAETVARTSKHPREAWTFLRFLINQQNLQTFYSEGGFKPTSRRDLIESQRQNAIYRPFIEQLGFAKSIPLIDEAKYQTILTDMITKINNGTNISEALATAQKAINLLIPSEGVNPPAAKL